MSPREIPQNNRRGRRPNDEDERSHDSENEEDNDEVNQQLQDEIAQLNQDIQQLDEELQLHQDNDDELMNMINEGMFSTYFLFLKRYNPLHQILYS